jgi:hypothetical protein
LILRLKVERLSDRFIIPKSNPDSQFLSCLVK